MANEELEIVEDIELGEIDEELDAAGLRLWRKAMRSGTWDPATIDFSRDRADFEAMEPRLRVYLERFCAAFYNAEENVARIFGPWVMAAPTTWQSAFLSTQMVEEYKHTDLFERFFAEVIGHAPAAALANPVHDTVEARGDKLLEALQAGLTVDDMDLRRLWVEAITHYQGIIEGVQANAGYQIFRNVFRGKLPGLSEGFLNIQRDEGRHVGFGLQVLRTYAREDPALARRIRELYDEYLPFIKSRYGQRYAGDDGVEYDPPEEERGLERLMALYGRRMKDIFGDAVPAEAVPA
ncbi:MAG: ribonucleoside-diphosphate reductase beta chain [bacterium]|jgi:ribonucleoside-diphosphate reductase beta chain